MLGLMQDRPLTLAHVFHRAEQLFGHKTLTTATADGETTTTVAEWAQRVRRLAGVLDTLGVSADGRVGSGSGKHPSATSGSTLRGVQETVTTGLPATSPSTDSPASSAIRMASSIRVSTIWCSGTVLITLPRTKI